MSAEAAAVTGASRAREDVPRLALSKTEAAAALGVSVRFFEQQVQPELRVVRRGRRRLIPVAELERWLDRAAARALEGVS
jgi:excisionase family DNA binding protein